MIHMLIRHKVADFAKWKPAYDAHASARQSAGAERATSLTQHREPQRSDFALFGARLQQGENVRRVRRFTSGDAEGRRKRQARRLFSRVADKVAVPVTIEVR